MLGYAPGSTALSSIWYKHRNWTAATPDKERQRELQQQVSLAQHGKIGIKRRERRESERERQKKQ